MIAQHHVIMSGGGGSQCDRNIKKLLPDNVLMHTFAHCFFIIFVII